MLDPDKAAASFTAALENVEPAKAPKSVGDLEFEYGRAFLALNQTFEKVDKAVKVKHGDGAAVAVVWDKVIPFDLLKGRIVARRPDREDRFFEIEFQSGKLGCIDSEAPILMTNDTSKVWSFLEQPLRDYFG